MDENLQELENELKRLSPPPLSAELLSRLEHELGPVPKARRYTSATSLRSWKWTGWSLAGATAVAGVFLALGILRQPSASPAKATPGVAPVAVNPAPAPAANRYEPVRASSVLYGMKDDGAATLPDKTEGRQVRYRYVDTYTWKNPKTNASMRWSVPRDEVRLVRASLD